MFYQFPVIRHIDDVLPHIQDRPEFVVAERDHYTVINYLVHTPGLFGVDTADLSLTDAIRRECRGIIFDKDGYIVSRPYHKFFNMGEQIETQSDIVERVMSDRSYQFLEKLDGSMVRPLLIDGKIRFATKMGLTEVASQVDDFLDANPSYGKLVRDFCYDCITVDCITPIFEWCSRNQRIVVDYPIDRLVLTAARDNIEGVYISELHKLVGWHGAGGIDIVRPVFDSMHRFSYVLTTVRESDTFEGIVMRFEDGHMVKVKSDWYCQLHRSKDVASRTHDVVRCILTDTVDDLKAQLMTDDRSRVEDLERRINAHILQLVVDLSKFVVDNRKIYGDSKKDFALRLQNNTGFSKDFNSVLFGIWDGKDAFDLVRKYMLSRTNTMSTCERYFQENGL